jgi:hypothetical protein
VLETFEVGFDTHLPDACFNQFADTIVNHGAGDTGIQAKAVGQSGSDIVLTTGYMDIDAACFAKRDDARIEPVYQGAERQEVQVAVIFAYVQ